MNEDKGRDLAESPIDNLMPTLISLFFYQIHWIKEINLSLKLNQNIKEILHNRRTDLSLRIVVLPDIKWEKKCEHTELSCVIMNGVVLFINKEEVQRLENS